MSRTDTLGNQSTHITTGHNSAGETFSYGINHRHIGGGGIPITRILVGDPRIRRRRHRVRSVRPYRRGRHRHN